MMINYLLKLFKVQPSEREKVSRISLMFLFVGLYLTFVSTISISVFDMRFGAKYLPYIYLLYPLLNLLFSFIYMKLMAILEKRELFRYFIISVIVIHLFNLAVMAGVFSNGMAIALYLLLNIVVIEKLYFLSMTVLQEVTNIESVKRILPLATASFTIGAILSVFLINTLANRVPCEALYAAALLFTFAISLLADRILKNHKAEDDSIASAGETSMKETFRYMKENRFIFLIVLLAVLVDIAYNMNDYLYNVSATAVIHKEASLVSFVSLTETVRNVLTLAIDIFLFSRVVSRLGSINAVKLVLGNAVLGMLMISIGGKYVFCILVSKVIFTVLVMQLSYSLTQILYQPVNQRYKDSVMIIADLVVSFGGSLLGGGITLLHSLGYLSSLAVALIAMVLSAAMFVVWQLRQRGFISVIEKTMNFSDSLEIENLMGKMGGASLVTYLDRKIERINGEEMHFLLGIMRRLDFEGKDRLVAAAFKKGDTEVKLMIFDMLFVSLVPGTHIYPMIHELDTVVMQELIRMTFKNYRSQQAQKVAEIIRNHRDDMDREAFGAVERLMLDYLCTADGNTYNELLQHLSASGKSDDGRTMVQIMTNFTGVEDSTNRSYLLYILMNLKQYQGILADAVELCACYDMEPDFSGMLLREVYTGYCQYEVVKKVCQYYGAEKIHEVLGRSPEQLIAQAYVLHAATKLPEEEMKACFDVYQALTEKLKEITAEMTKISRVNHPVGGLLLEEVERLRISAIAVALEYLLIYHRMPEVPNLEEHLTSDNGRNLVSEIVKNSFPAKISDEVTALINRDAEQQDENFNYRVFVVGGMHQMLSNLYMILGGETMEQQFSKEIEGIVSLKMVPMFSEMNIEALYKVLEIAEFKVFSPEAVVVEKGVPGAFSYVILEGEVEVFLNPEDAPITTIGKGEMFGEIAVVDGGLTTAQVRAAEEVLALQFEKEHLLSLLRRNADIAISIIQTTSKRLETTRKKKK